MSLWLFNIYMDGVMREMKGKVVEVGVRMYAEGRKWVLRRLSFIKKNVQMSENTGIAKTAWRRTQLKYF